MFYFILIVDYIINKVRVWYSWSRRVLVISRTWVRSQVPHPFPYYFSNNAFVQFLYKSPPYNPWSQHATRLSRSIKGLCFGDHHGHESKKTHAGIKVKQGHRQVGQNCYNKPSNLGTDPPWFAFLILFSYFFYFCFN